MGLFTRAVPLQADEADIVLEDGIMGEPVEVSEDGIDLQADRLTGVFGDELSQPGLSILFVVLV